MKARPVILNRTETLALAKRLRSIAEALENTTGTVTSGGLLSMKRSLSFTEKDGVIETFKSVDFVVTDFFRVETADDEEVQG